MVGKRKILGPPCSSAAPSNALWPPTSCAKMPRQPCFRNGSSVKIRNFSTRMATPGSHARTRHSTARPPLPGRSRAHSPAPAQPADQVCTGTFRPKRIRGVHRCHRRLDNQRCLLEWKTTSARYPEKPDGLLALDPQLVCYSWITGVSEVAQVVFVRKRLVEIQYLRTTINDEQRREFGQLVESTIRQIESAQFLPHSGIRFPQNPCSSCPYIGLCLGRQELVEAALIRRPGAESLDWLDELHY